MVISDWGVPDSAVVDFFVSTLNASAPILSAVLVFLLGRYLWTWRSMPVLNFTGTSTVTGYQYDPDEWDNAPLHYRVHLENLGFTAADNCKPELRLKGSKNQIEYQVQTPLCWSEGEYPARSTINRGESIAFDIFRQGTIGTNNYLRFPSETGWPDYTTLIEGIISSEEDTEGMRIASAERNKTKTSDLEPVDWETAEVIVTSENSDSIRAKLELELTLDDRIREDVSVKIVQTQGSALLVWRRFVRVISKSLPSIPSMKILYN